MVNAGQESIRPNDKVLAYHGPLIYEAKVLKAHEAGKTFVVDADGKHEPVKEINLPAEYAEFQSYFLHYKGWKPKWDEWVPADRVMVYNEENLALKQKIKQEFAASKKPASQKATESKKTNGKRKSVEKSEVKPKKKKSDIILPMHDKLKYLLVDDWEYITKDRKLVQIPAQLTVNAILDEYLDYTKMKKETSEYDVAKEVVTGLEAYFNESLKLLLLYKFEKLQYANLLKEPGVKKPADVYGFEHLLRLFVTLPALIAETSMDAPSVQVLVSESSKILDFLVLRYERFVNEYEYTTPAYDALARS